MMVVFECDFKSENSFAGTLFMQYNDLLLLCKEYNLDSLLSSDLYAKIFDMVSKIDSSLLPYDQRLSNSLYLPIKSEEDYILVELCHDLVKSGKMITRNQFNELSLEELDHIKTSVYNALLNDHGIDRKVYLYIYYITEYCNKLRCLELQRTLDEYIEKYGRGSCNQFHFNFRKRELEKASLVIFDGDDKTYINDSHVFKEPDKSKLLEIKKQAM